MAKTISDPLGNEVFIPQTIMDLSNHMDQSEDVIDDMSKVIEKPIMLFRKKEGQAQLYYLRAVGWNKTMLIGVQKANGQLEVTSYEMDPSIERITELHSTFERLI